MYRGGNKTINLQGKTHINKVIFDQTLPNSGLTATSMCTLCRRCHHHTLYCT